MNLKHFFFVLCAAVTLTSCFKDYDAQYTPQVYPHPQSAIVCNSTDTLAITTSNGSWQLDTIQVNDTVRALMVFDALGNYLLTARITWDTVYADLNIGKLDSINSILLPTSDPKAGVFHLPTGYQGLVLPIEYIAKKAGTPELIFTAESDSKYSPAELKFKTPIK